MRGAILLVLLLFSIAASAPHPASAGLELYNGSQFALLELRIHEDQSYDGAANILDVPLLVGETISVASEGAAFITVFREKYERGPTLAFTTSRAIHVEKAGSYRVTIFDESFRIEDLRDIETSGGCSCSGITRGM
jgi:hypothetical protein